jgi:CARDB
MGSGYGQTGTSGYDLEPLFEVLDPGGFGDIGRQALRATETIAQSVRTRNGQYRAVAVGFNDLASFHESIAMRRAYRAMEQFGAVEALIKELRNKPEWRTQVLPRLNEAFDSGAVRELVHEASRALLDIDDLSGKSAQEFMAVIRPYGSPGSFDNLLNRLQSSIHEGSSRAADLALAEVSTGTVESARALCAETGFGLLAIAVVVSRTVPTRSHYQFAALVRLVPTVLSACSAIVAIAPPEPAPPPDQKDLPDLVLLPGPQGGFCAESPEGRPESPEGRAESPEGRIRIIDFIVRNSGTGAAGSSLTLVSFRHPRPENVTLPTPPLGPNQEIPFQVRIPPGCFDPDCEATITVDADDEITESDKDNNVRRVICPGEAEAESPA